MFFNIFTNTSECVNSSETLISTSNVRKEEHQNTEDTPDAPVIVLSPSTTANLTIPCDDKNQVRIEKSDFAKNEANDSDVFKKKPNLKKNKTLSGDITDENGLDSTNLEIEIKTGEELTPRSLEKRSRQLRLLWSGKITRDSVVISTSRGSSSISDHHLNETNSKSSKVSILPKSTVLTDKRNDGSSQLL